MVETTKKQRQLELKHFPQVWNINKVIGQRALSCFSLCDIREIIVEGVQNVQGSPWMSGVGFLLWKKPPSLVLAHRTRILIMMELRRTSGRNGRWVIV
jgi:hypothetical protein